MEARAVISTWPDTTARARNGLRASVLGEIDQPVAIGLVPDDFDLPVVGPSAQYGSDTVGAVELLAVFGQEIEDFARRQGLVRVGVG
jgi:hypothetical protein